MKDVKFMLSNTEEHKLEIIYSKKYLEEEQLQNKYKTKASENMRRLNLKLSKRDFMYIEAKSKADID